MRRVSQCFGPQPMPGAGGPKPDSDLSKRIGEDHESGEAGHEPEAYPIAREVELLSSAKHRSSAELISSERSLLRDSVAKPFELRAAEGLNPR